MSQHLCFCGQPDCPFMPERTAHEYHERDMYTEDTTELLRAILYTLLNIRDRLAEMVQTH